MVWDINLGESGFRPQKYLGFFIAATYRMTFFYDSVDFDSFLLKSV